METDVEIAPSMSPKRTALIAVSITAFLFIFRPFGLSINSFSQTLVVLGFAPLNFIAMQAVHNVRMPSGRIRMFLSTSLILGTNLVYLLFWSTSSSLLPSAMNVVLIAGLTIGAVAMWNRYRSLTREVLALKQHPVSNNPKLIVLTGEGDNEILRLTALTLRYVQARGNYTEVNYEKLGEPTQSLIRATLGSIAEQAELDTLIRCHRSYLANLEVALRVVSDQNGMRIEFSDDVSIPVSRTYRADIRTAAKAR